MPSSYVIIENYPGAAGPVSQIDTVPRVPLGVRARAADFQTGKTSIQEGGAECVYARGSDATTNGQFVMITQGTSGGGVSAVLRASGNSTCWWPIGVLAGAPTGTGQFGWVQVEGLCDYATCSNTSVAANARLALGSTAGQVGSVTALGSAIHGINVPVSFTSSQTSLTVYLGPTAGFLIGVTASN